MKKGIILYESKYGATKKYVDWLIEETKFDSIVTSKADISKVKLYDCILLAGGIYASGISGLSFLKKNYAIIKEKKVGIFCVGASPYEENAFKQIREHNLNKDIKDIPCYYGRGAWDEEKMSFKDKTLCKMLQKVVAKQDPQTYEPWQKALMCAVGQKCDWTDKKYLQPLLEWLEI
ncbi:MAG: flavodoxin domain-containing protein [Clostridia bacterium]